MKEMKMLKNTVDFKALFMDRWVSPVSPRLAEKDEEYRRFKSALCGPLGETRLTKTGGKC